MKKQIEELRRIAKTAQADERKEAMAQGGFILMSRDHSVDSYFEGYEQALKDMERLLEEREANERS